MTLEQLKYHICLTRQNSIFLGLTVHLGEEAEVSYSLVRSEWPAGQSKGQQGLGAEIWAGSTTLVVLNIEAVCML